MITIRGASSWFALAMIAVLGIGGLLVATSPAIASPSDDVLAASVGGTCFNPTFDCVHTSFCFNTGIPSPSPVSIYFDYTHIGHGQSDVNLGLMCYSASYYSAINCVTLTGVSIIWACSI
jgi:hypothetical protein